MRYAVTHTTRYEYSTPAALSLNDLCLSPRSTPFQRVLSRRFLTEPAEETLRERVDWFGNAWRSYAFERPHRSLAITAEHEVEVTRAPGEGSGPGEDRNGGWEPFLLPSPFVPLDAEYRTYGQTALAARDEPRKALEDLTRRLFEDFTYDPKATEISTPVAEFFRGRRGVCQDFSHLMLAVLRSSGVPARYVSGYLNTQPPPGKPKVFGADASHAWVAAWFSGLGWIDADPTNGVLVGSDHITIGWGRDYGDVTPLKGVVLGGGVQTLKVEVSVRHLA